MANNPVGQSLYYCIKLKNPDWGSQSAVGTRIANAYRSFHDSYHASAISLNEANSTDSFKMKNGYPNPQDSNLLVCLLNTGVFASKFSVIP